jgi:hypothetical protein
MRLAEEELVCSAVFGASNILKNMMFDGASGNEQTNLSIWQLVVMHFLTMRRAVLFARRQHQRELASLEPIVNIPQSAIATKATFSAMTMLLRTVKRVLLS